MFRVNHCVMPKYSHHSQETALSGGEKKLAKLKTGGGARLIFAMLMLTPALMLGAIQILTRSDPETWLSQHAKGYARRDAFNGVTNIMPLFSVLFAGTSLLAAFCVCRQLPQFLISLTAGPMLASLVYLIIHGFSDPAWFTLLALLTIGMLVGSSVTAVWVMLRERAAR